MAFDAANSVTVTHDISANTVQASTAKDLGRTGLVEGMMLAVVVTDGSAANFSANPVNVYFEYSLDGGTSWRRGGAARLRADANGLPPQLVEFPVGFKDIVPMASPGADIKWRVVSDIGATIVSADDFTYTAYLGHATGYHDNR